MREKQDAIKDLETNFRCREYEGFDHFHAECPNFLKRQSKSYIATLSDDESESNSDSGEEICALVGCLSLEGSHVVTPSNIEISVVPEKAQENGVSHNNLSFEETYQCWIEDTQVFTVQKERIKKLIKDNHRLLNTI